MMASTTSTYSLRQQVEVCGRHERQIRLYIRTCGTKRRDALERGVPVCLIWKKMKCIFRQTVCQFLECNNLLSIIRAQESTISRIQEALDGKDLEARARAGVSAMMGGGYYGFTVVSE